eukprot:11059154-Heterocapsa_arctica.AAC.1
MTGHSGEVHRKSCPMPVWVLRLSALRNVAAAWGSGPAAGAEAGGAWLPARACPGGASAAAVGIAL